MTIQIGGWQMTRGPSRHVGERRRAEQYQQLESLIGRLGERVPSARSDVFMKRRQHESEEK